MITLYTKRLIIVCFSAILCSCVSISNIRPTYKDKLDNWVGRDVNVLYKSWGIPTKSQTNPDGSLLAEYSFHEQETTESYTTGGYWVGQGRSRSYVLPTYHPEVTKDYYAAVTFVISDNVVESYIVQGSNIVLESNVKQTSSFNDEFNKTLLEKVSASWVGHSEKQVIRSYGKNYTESTPFITYNKTFKQNGTLYNCQIIFEFKDEIVVGVSYTGDIDGLLKVVKPCINY